MQQEAFPDPATYDFLEWTPIGNYFFRSHDIVAFGTPLTPENVREAYRKGIFPWYTEGLPLPWHCPEWRAVLDLDEVRVTRSLGKVQRKSEYTFSIDKDFAGVIRGCSHSNRPGQFGTWITPQFQEVYTRLHRDGLVHSV